MSQTRPANPFRPGSGIFPPLLTGREPETSMLEARVERTREGHPQHTALLGEWAIGKTTLLMHWRRRLQESGDRVVLTMAYPQTRNDLLAGLATAVGAEAGSGWTAKMDLEVGLDVGVAEAHPDLAADRPRARPKENVGVGPAGPHGPISRDRGAAEDRHGVDQDLIAPREREARPDQELPTIGRDDSAEIAVECETVDRVSS